MEDGRQILLVKVEERSKTSGRLVIDNFGSKNIGPLRARLSVEGVALLADSDYMNVTFRTNPVDPKELAAASVTYGIGLDNNGTRAEVAVAWSESEIDARRNRATRDASSRYASLAITHPVRRSRTANLWVDSQFEYLKVEAGKFWCDPAKRYCGDRVGWPFRVAEGRQWLAKNRNAIATRAGPFRRERRRRPSLIEI